MLETLQKKFFLNFLIFGLMASLGISSMIYIFMRERILNQFKDSLSVYSSFSSTLVLNRNDIVFTYLEGVANEQTLRDQNTSLTEKLTLINKIGEGNKYFNQLGIILPNGYLYTIDIESGDIRFSDVKDTEYFKDTIRGNRSIMNPDYIENIEEQEKLSVIYSVPIKEGNDIVGGIVGISNSDFLHYLVKDISYGRSGYTFMVDKDGYLLAHPNAELVEAKINIFDGNENFIEYNDFFRFIEDSLENNTGKGTYKYRGRSYYSVYKKIGNNDWYVFNTALKVEVFETFKIIYIGIIIFNAIIIITGYYIYKKFNRDIVEREKQLREERGTLEYQASYDEFTGVYNRRYGLEVLENSMKTSRENNISLLIIYIDIDDLKYVNDNFGHLEGDKLIKRVIEKVKKNIRDSDFIIRMGGDEFIVGLFSCNDLNGEIFLDRINREVNKTIDKSQVFEKISFSYGAVEYNEDKHRSIEDIVKEADAIMYENKMKNKY